MKHQQKNLSHLADFEESVGFGQGETFKIGIFVTKIFL